MAVKCFATLEIKSGDRLGPQGVEWNLLLEIAQGLDAKGIKCMTPIYSATAVGMKCRTRGSILVITIPVGIRLSPSRARLSIWCTVHMSLWKSIIKPRRYRFSGEPLEHVRDEVESILASHPRIDQIQWYEPDEWRGLQRSEPDTGLAPEDWAH